MRAVTVESFDAAIVLGARLRPDGGPSPALARRVAHGARLVAEGLAPALVLSGGPTRHDVPEARVMGELALAHGIPASAIHLEERALNTIQNALFTAPLAQSRGWRRLVVVTDPFHMPRALYVFRRFGLDAAGSAAPPDRRGKEWWLAHLREAGAFPWTVLRVERRLLLKDFGP